MIMATSLANRPADGLLDLLELRHGKRLETINQIRGAIRSRIRPMIVAP
jgi:hypothetical protein